MATLPQYAATPNNGVMSQQVSTTNTDITLATGSTDGIFTAGASGARIDTIKVKSAQTAASVAGLLRLYIYDGTANYKLVHEESITAVTPSTTTASFDADITFTDGLILAPTYELHGVVTTANTLDVTIMVGGDF